ncbi:MAG TPA: beta-galactosidase, partial [Tepidisphaeraceae bacterium]|nr:beta-galactosidase [Tepidisphaeraceae bacterium]
MRPSPAAQRSPVASLEPLEVRRMFARRALAAAIVPPSLSDDGVLYVTGTDAADTVGVTRILAGGADELRVSVGKQRYYFRTADVGRIAVSLGAGDDLLDVNQKQNLIEAPVRASGDAGDDTLHGTVANDSLDGGLGDDSISGGYGNDLLIGDAGDDSLFGGKGDDSLYGNDGDDRLDDDRGDNRLLGGAGRDKIRQGTVQPPEFMIGVWYQPWYGVASWKKRGLNMMVGADLSGGRDTMQKWDQAVAAQGMVAIRQPSGNIDYDKGVESLLAYMGPDEPDLHHTDPAVVQKFYQDLKEADPDRPVFVNFSGGILVGYHESNRKHPYAAYVEGADWTGNDIYPVTGWNLPKRLPLVGHAVDILRSYAPDKPQFAFIEASDQNLSWVPQAPGVNRAQFTAEIWNAVIHGVRGIVYFPQSFNPFDYDNANAEINDEMAKQNAKLHALSPVIMSKIDPKGYGVELPAGFEATWRVHDGKLYVIVLNLNTRARPDAEIKI